MNNKIRISTLFASLAVLGGCQSTSLQSIVEFSDEPSADDIYQGTIGFCESPSFEIVTKNVGNSPSKSPEERKAEKERFWSRWQEKRTQMKSDVAGKQFTVSNPAGFSKYNKETGLMKFYEKGSMTGRSRYEQSAIPDHIVFSTYDQWLTEGALDKYGIPLNRSNNVYAINDYDISLYNNTKIRDARYGGAPASISRYTNKLMSVNFSTKKWFESANSPVVFRDGSFYLDTNKVDIYENFGVYPDIGTPYIDINYTFEFSGCTNGRLLADVKEITLESRKGIAGIYGNEIYRVTF